MKKIFIGIDESGITNRHFKNLIDIKLKNFVSINSLATVTFIVFFEKDYYDFKFKYENFKLKNNIEKTNIHFSKIKNDYLSIKWLMFLKNYNFKIYHSVIDINSHYQRYKNNSRDPYFISLEYFLNKILNDYKNFNLNIFIESRGWNFDNDTNSFLYSLTREKNWFKNIEKIKICKKNQSYNNNYPIIEVADTISFLLTNIYNSKNKNFKYLFFYEYYIKNFVLNKFKNYPKTKNYSFKIIK